MKKIVLSVYLFLIAAFCVSSQSFQTQIINKNIQTLQLKASNDFNMPVIRLNSDDVLEISFDELSHDSKYYGYEVLHCNADWTLSPTEFSENLIPDVISLGEMSFNTTVQYTHYRFYLPNENIRFKFSGNYVLKIYENNDPDDLIAIARFSIVDARINIEGKVRSNTDTEINGAMQQLDFYIYPNNYTIQDAYRELKIAVFQNRRLDNAVSDLQPTYISRDKLSYINNRALIFEGGNEYRGFDFSSVYTYSENIEQISYKKPYYNVELANDRIAPRVPYTHLRDANGRYVINLQRSRYPDTEADYAFVYFTLPTEQPFFDGAVYLLGDINHNLLDNEARMFYNSQRKAYEKVFLLKQGGYNYQYVFQAKGSKAASAARIGGSHWQTENEYAIFVYHRPFGERYDKLIGVEIVNSR